MTTIFSFLTTVFAFGSLYALIGALVPRLPGIRTRRRALIGAVGAFVLVGVCQNVYTNSLSPEEKAALALKQAAEEKERDAKRAADEQQKDAVRASSREAEDAKYQELRASQLVEIYTDNEISADSRFKGKGIQVTGTIASIGKDIMDSPYITVGSGAEHEFRTVQCMLAKKSVAAAANLSKGDQVTVRGTVRGLMMNVLVKDCTIQ